jgi:type IX secretion system substrate protein
MHRNYPSLILLFVSFLMIAITSKGTHIYGGDISYKQIDSNKYEVTYKLYRDCNGVNAPSNINIVVSSNGCSSAFSVNINRVSVTDITTLCSTAISACVSPSPNLWGFEENVYRGIVTVPSGCNNLQFSYETCCRNGLSANLVNANSQSMFIDAHVDYSNQPVHINNSPVFQSPPYQVGMAAPQQTFDFHAIDPDGDSLDYTLVTPLGAGGNPLAFAPGYTAAQPLLGTSSLDKQTGLFTVNPTIIQSGVVTIRVDEFRNGNKIGSTKRDIVLIFTNASNTMPIISGINNSNNYSISVVEGDTVNFNIYSSDQNKFDTLTMTWDSGIANADFTIDTTLNFPVGTFSWVTDSASVQFGPHLFKVTVRDRRCPINAINTKFFKIYVLATDTIAVWPGDANNDYKADLFDALPIGIAYGQTGLIRNNATTNWTGQVSQDWATSFVSGLNHKYADCNGDGIIDSLDLTAIDLNYGNTHNRLTYINQNAANADLKMEFQRDTIYPGEWVTANILLGDNQNPVNDLYGIAFSIVYDPALIVADSVYLDVSSSWIGQQHNDLLLFSKNISSQSVLHNSLVRTDHSNVTGNGLIAKFKFKIADQLPQPLNILNLAFANQIITDVNENLKQVTTSVDTVVVADRNVGINDLVSQFRIYPNPVDDVIIVESGLIIEEVELLDLNGKVIFTQKSRRTGTRLNTSTIPAGHYFLSIVTEKGKLTRSIIISH